MLVMEYVGGGNLAKNLSQDRAEPRKLGWYRNGRFVLLGVARGLAFIHSRNVRPTAHLRVPWSRYCVQTIIHSAGQATCQLISYRPNHRTILPVVIQQVSSQHHPISIAEMLQQCCPTCSREEYVRHQHPEGNGILQGHAAEPWLVRVLCLVQVIIFDIKAGNVMMDQDGVTAKITDVGLSKVLAGSNTATLLVRAHILLMPWNRPVIESLAQTGRQPVHKIYRKTCSIEEAAACSRRRHHLPAGF